MIRPRCLSITLLETQFFKPHSLFRRQFLRGLQPKIARMAQKNARLAFFPAGPVHGLIDDLDDVELVERQLRHGKILSCSLDECRRHVTAQLPNVLSPTAMFRQKRSKAGHHRRILPIRHEYDAPRVEVHKDGDIVMSTAAGRFIEANTSDTGEVQLFQRTAQVVLYKPPHAGIGHTQLLPQRLDGHHRSQVDYPPFEKQSEAAALTRPGNADLMDTACSALHTRNASGHIGFKLEEVEVSPGSFCRIMNAPILRPARWTGKFSSFRKVDANIEAVSIGIELYGLDIPRLLQTKRDFKYLNVFHNVTTIPLLTILNSSLPTLNIEEPNFPHGCA